MKVSSLCKAGKTYKEPNISCIEQTEKVTYNALRDEIKYYILVFHSTEHYFETYAKNFMIVRKRFKGTVKKNRGYLLNMETPST